MDWNFVKLYLAIQQEGNIGDAAKVLNMSEPTLFRHLTAYEKQFGKLFTRKNGTYFVTELGESLLASSLQIQSLFGDVERAVAAQSEPSLSRVRITAPTSFSYGYLPAIIEKLKLDRPDIAVDLLVSNDTLCLNTRQADIAIRVTSSPPDNFIGSKVREISWGIYGGYGYLSKYGIPTSVNDLTQHRLIGGSGSLARGKAFSWLHKRLGSQITINTDDFVAMFYLAEKNHGLALLPDEFNQGNIKRLFTIDEIGTNSLWVLTHSDYRGVERVRAVARYLAEYLTES